MSLVGLWTIRLGAGALIEYSSRSRAEDMTITNVIIKTPDMKCDWGVNDVMPRSENLVISKKTSVEIWLWAGRVQLGVGCGRCSKNCVSLSPRVERLKLKKWINVSYLNNESRQCFGISLHLNILHIRILVAML